MSYVFSFTVLADALVAAVEAPNSPRLVVDFATLTGKNRWTIIILFS